VTLVVAFQGVDGLVLATDSRGTIGDPRGLTAITDSMVKMFKLTKYVGILAYGQAELAAQLVTEVQKILKPEDLYVSQILEKVRTVLRTKYGDWLKAVPQENRPVVGFILGGLEEDGSAKIYYLSSPLDFAPQLAVTRIALGGIPQYATYLTHRLYNPKMSRKHLVSLAVYVISETATQDPKVGGPIRVAEISKDKGYIELEQNHIQEVMKRNEEINRKLREFFFGEVVEGIKEKR
jgi:20S proteasome alpha/beta subunit